MHDKIIRQPPGRGGNQAVRHQANKLNIPPTYLPASKYPPY